MNQDELFTTEGLLPGLVYRPEFITRDEESSLVEVIRAFPLTEARYREFTARRRTVSFGGSYDFSEQELKTAAPIPESLHWIRARVAGLMGVEAASVRHALVAEYAPGTPLGWHRDVAEFESVGGLSLLGRARMRLRPYPHHRGDRTSAKIELEPRSAYVLKGPARWNWQHAISPTRELRYSLTFRTLRG
jgi:alkylated DNA repair dioxygenase AlkB